MKIMTSFALTLRQFISSAENLQFARIFSRAHLLRKSTLIFPPWIMNPEWKMIPNNGLLLFIIPPNWLSIVAFHSALFDFQLKHFPDKSFKTSRSLTRRNYWTFACCSYRNLCSKKNKLKSQDNRRESKRFPFNVWVSFYDSLLILSTFDSERHDTNFPKWKSRRNSWWGNCRYIQGKSKHENSLDEAFRQSRRR